MNKKNFTILLIMFCFLTGMSYAQQQEDKRIKVEITVKEGSKTIKASARSATISYSRSVNNTVGEDGKPKKEESKNYYFSVDFEKQDLALLRAFMKNKNGIDGQITMVDSYGKLPSRKIEFTKATLDAMSEQLTADYNSAYLSIVCSSLIVDGVNLE